MSIFEPAAGEPDQAHLAQHGVGDAAGVDGVLALAHALSQIVHGIVRLRTSKRIGISPHVRKPSPYIDLAPISR
jgi:hypothetical protein